MGSKRRRHAEKVFRNTPPVIENDGQSITLPMTQAFPRSMDQTDIVDMIEDFGGVLDPCDGCPGFIAYGFADGPYVGGAMHFGPEGCPSRHKVPKLPLQ